MPKTRTITSPSGSDLNLRTLGDTTPTTNTLGGLLRDAFNAAVADKQGIVNLNTGKLTIVPASTAVNAAISGMDAGLIGTITKDDTSKASSPMTMTYESGKAASYPELAGFVDALFASVKPSISVESCIGKLEDMLENEVAALSDGGVDGIVLVVDQTAGTIRIYAGPASDAEAINGASLYAEEAEFVATIAAAGGLKFGE